ncbi:MAG: DUF2807 domain-containing protein [Rikenellaceae bacterium]
MRIKNLLILTVLLGALSCVSINDGGNKITASDTHKTQSIELLDSFIGIEASSGIDVLYTQSSEGVAVEVYAPENIAELIGVEVKGGMLKVDYTRPVNITKNEDSKIEVRVSAPALSEFHASSSSDIKLIGGINTTGNLKFRVKSSGEIKGEIIECQELDADATSSGDLSLDKVVCNKASLVASASGEIEIEGLNCSEFSAHASSSGEINVEQLYCNSATIQVTSAGEIELSGECQTADIKAYSSGNIKAYNFDVQKAKVDAKSAGEIRCSISQELTSDRNSMSSIRYKGQPNRIFTD